MALAQITKTQKKVLITDEAKNVLLSKLDEAIDDMENGRVQNVEDVWMEIDAI